MHHVVLRVHGRVQRVGYRHFIATRAAGLGLHGSVRNLPDGDVEVIAEGARPELHRLIEQARQGPPNARVTGIDAEWSEGEPRATVFRIL